jgi:hypothetical protein
MYSESDLTVEIRREIDRTLAAGRITPPEWICHDILTKHPFPGTSKDWKTSNDKDLRHLGGHGFVRGLVRTVLREYKTKTDRGEGEREPGFKHFQQAYLIERKVGRGFAQRIVPLRKMSRAAGLAKYHEIRAMARGCDAHADELARYFGFTPVELEGEAAE